jgi:hypothetical protein
MMGRIPLVAVSTIEEENSRGGNLLAGGRNNEDS